MSLYDYHKSSEISSEDPPFAALIMAAIRKADSNNLTKLRVSFPAIFEEFWERYDNPGGYLNKERK